MNKVKGRYKVSWEEGGVDWKSFSDDAREAIKFALEKKVVSDHVVIVYDTLTNNTIYKE